MRTRQTGRFCFLTALVMMAASGAIRANAQTGDLTGGTLGTVLYATGGPATVKVQPATAGYTSELHLLLPGGGDQFLALNTQPGTVVNLPVFPAGTEMKFYIYVRNTGQTFFMGPAGNNPDGVVHAAVLALSGANHVLVGFEDLFGGGDRDYDDNVFEFTGVTPNQPPTAAAGADQTIECAGASTQVTLNGSGSSDPDGTIVQYTWSENGVDFASGAQITTALGDGPHTITLTVTDNDGATGTDTVAINIVDTTAPVISGASVSKSMLWPPNHKMVDILVSYSVSDVCDPTPSCSLSITSNEPDNGLGDGDTANDFVVIDAHHIRLRAERAGGGTGRIYTITITCTDDAGNSATKNLTVTVPHNL